MRIAESYEVVVVGGGMVGAFLGTALARAGIHTAVLESTRPDPDPDTSTIDLRVSALSLATRNMLDYVGAWDLISNMRTSPYRSMRVYDAGYHGELSFEASDLWAKNLGYIVENRVIVAALWSLLSEAAEADIIYPARVVKLLGEPGNKCVELEDGRRVRSRVVVAADGARSVTRGLAGIGVGGWNYDQSALVAAVETENPHRQTAYQRFLAEGPLAFLPLDDGRCSIVWSSTRESTRSYMELDDAAFMAVLEQASGGLLGAIKDVGPRGSFELGFQYAKQYIRDGVVLVGDAAHSVHPLAGQGVNIGMLDAAALVEILLEARANNRDPAALSVLRKYERWRKADNLALLGGIDLLKRLFTADNGLIGSARSLGMNLINHSSPVKNYLNRYAMGIRDDLPAMAKNSAAHP